MQYSTLRFGIASIAAMTSLAAPSAGAVPDPVASVRESCGSASHCDAVIEFLLATGDDMNPDMITPALEAAFGDLTQRNARDTARFLRELEALGIADELRAAIEFQLVEKIRLSNLPEARKARFLDRLADVPGGMGCYTVAQGGSEVTSDPAACGVRRNAYQV